MQSIPLKENNKIQKSTPPRPLSRIDITNYLGPCGIYTLFFITLFPFELGIIITWILKIPVLH